ncbi:TolC family protein, partial [Rhizobium brockwellii]
MRHAALPLAAVLLLAGCIGPRPAAPTASAVVPPPAWRTALGPGSPIAADWWQAFGDPQLTALVTRA